MLTPTAHARPVPVPPFWQALAQCETGARWDWGAQQRPSEGPIYEGGLGMYRGTYAMWAKAVGVYTRYPHAYLAPPMVQVRVARYGLARGGAWGCLRAHPEYLALAGR